MQCTEGSPLLAGYLGLPTPESLADEERTLVNLNRLHKERTLDLIRLGFKGNQLARNLLFKEGSCGHGQFSILEKLFDDQLTIGITPIGLGQHEMNQMLIQCLAFAFNITNILKEEHGAPKNLMIVSAER